MGQVSGITGGSSSELRDNYLKLLLTQLQNQNPLDPMDNSQMTAQLTQLSELEQLEQMGTSFDRVLTATQLQHATSLMGKEITWLPEDASEPVSAKVESVERDGEQVLVRAGGRLVDPDLILTIKN
jgi:flagellar basal-body rod modification protein FlgD